MECIQRLTHRLLPSTVTGICFKTVTTRSIRVNPLAHTRNPLRNPLNNPRPVQLIPGIRHQESYSSSSAARAGWFLGLKDKKTDMPDIVKAGDPVLHEPAREVTVEEIGSDRIQKIIDDMVKVMRKAPGVGLAAPQIGIPLKVCSLHLYIHNQLRKLNI